MITVYLLPGLLLLLSFLLLWKGADVLVEGAAALGRRFRLSEVTVGLTIVAFGTSAPEFAVTFVAAFTGRADISVGNVVGSNIFNLGFILGGCALVVPLRTGPKVVWRDGMVLIGASSVLLLFLLDGTLSRWEGAILLGGLVTYLALLIHGRESFDAPAGPAPGTGAAGSTDVDPSMSQWGMDVSAMDEASQGSTMGNVLRVLVGTVAVVGGGHLLVHSASDMAALLGVSQWAIAVTVVAAGTSAPEVATSLTAALRGYHGMSVGNLVGSDLFNILGVLGAAGLLRPLTVTGEAWQGTAMLVGMCMLTVLFLRTGWRISRLEGAVLVMLGLIRWGIDLSS